MKAKYVLICMAVLTILPAVVCSCGVDRWAAYAERTKTDRWIDDTMRTWYYWYRDMPDENHVNYFVPPFEFFESVLSPKDGKGGYAYSTIDSLETGTRSIPYTDYSYGFQFTTNRVESNDTALYAHILYVAKGSPADEAGLQRGDWIMEMDGEVITQDNYAALLGSRSMQLTVGYYDAANDTVIAYEEPMPIAQARAVNDNPVHHLSVFDMGNGKPIGYLVYNHFTPGMTDGGQEYDNALREAFRQFAAYSMDDFILDLRYNNGGSLSSAQLLCAMLAPASALGQELGYLEFNDRFAERKQPFSLNQELIGQGANLNLSHLYVLTSDQTASASEMVINCLMPYMDVTLIGARTEGKNVGSTTFTNQELGIEMHPIVCTIYNAKGQSDYENGFQPNLTVYENTDLSRFLPFGNPNEALLNAALGLIYNNSAAPQAETKSRMKVSVTSNSIARRATSSVDIGTVP